MEKPDLLQETSELLMSSAHGGSIAIGDRRYDALPGVFNPAAFPSTRYYAATLPVRGGCSVLEIGTGSGVIAIEAAHKGAKEVYATDINDIAVENAMRNVREHGLVHTVKVLRSDVFADVPRRKFDLIFWSMPFGFVARPAPGMLERATFDHEYTSIRAYFAGAREHLADDGMLLFGFSKAIGSEEVLDRILAEHDWRKELLAQTLLQEGRQVDFGLYRAVPR